MNNTVNFYDFILINLKINNCQLMSIKTLKMTNNIYKKYEQKLLS